MYLFLSFFYIVIHLPMDVLLRYYHVISRYIHTSILHKHVSKSQWDIENGELLLIRATVL